MDGGEGRTALRLRDLPGSLLRIELGFEWVGWRPFVECAAGATTVAAVCDLVLSEFLCSLLPFLFSMIVPETFNHIENIKKRAGHLWRFL